MAPVYVKTGRKGMLRRWVASASQRIRLFKNDIVPDEDTVLADLEEADFSGYTDAVPAWGPITVNGDGNAQVIGSLAQFVHDGGVVANDVYGWYITEQSSGVNELHSVERYSDAPRVMEFEDDEIDVTYQQTEGGCPA